MTGDEMGGMARLLGGLLFGGPVGLALEGLRSTLEHIHEERGVRIEVTGGALGVHIDTSCGSATFTAGTIIAIIITAHMTNVASR